MRAGYMLAIGLALAPAAAFATETVTYQYDAKGRLTNVAHAGGPAAGQVTTYTLDPADNRTNTATTGAFYDDPRPLQFVVPLGGARPIPLPQS